MKLTALEIKQQKFERSIRGYDISEVNAFLGVVASEWEHLVGKNRELENEIQQMRDKLKHYERVEEALHETLQTAKESAEQRLSGAKSEAKNRIEKAEMEAERIVREAQQQRQQMRQGILGLLDRREEIIRGISSYLDLAKESLDSFSRDEAAMFSLPKEEESPVLKRFEQNGESRNNNHNHQAEKNKNTVPGVEDIDDILDEIE